VGSFLYTLIDYDNAYGAADVRAFFFDELLGAAELALLANPFDFGYVEHLPFEGEGSIRAVVNLRSENVEASEVSMPPETLRELEQHRLTHFATLDVFFLRGAQHLYAIAQRSPRPPRFYASTTRHVLGIVELDEPLDAAQLKRAVLATGDRLERALAKGGLVPLLCPAPLRLYCWGREHLMLPAASVEVRIDCLLGSVVERWRPVASLQVEGRLGRAWLDWDGLHLVPSGGLTPDRVLAMSEELERLEEELRNRSFAKAVKASLVSSDPRSTLELRGIFSESDVWKSDGALYVRPHRAELAERLRGLTAGAAEVEVRLLPAEQAVFSDEVIAVWRFLRRVEELLS
jgi:acyl transferase domain-containing protein